MTKFNSILFLLFIFPCCVFCVLLFFVLCVQCCQCLWIVHCWLPLQYSLRLVCPMLPVSLDYIGHTRWRENRRDNQQWTIQRHWQQWPHKTKRILKGQSTMVFSSSCVANVASVSGLSIVDCPFSIIFVLCGHYCQCLSIVYCWLPLRLDTGNSGHTRRR
jgi:hypothetical protein